MIVQWVFDMSVRWMGLSPMGKVAFVMIASLVMAMGFVCAVYGAIKILDMLDRKFKRQVRAMGVIKGKYIVFPKGDEYEEVDNTPENRADPRARFMVKFDCGKSLMDGLMFEQAVDRETFDQLSKGEKVPVTYEIGRISELPRLVDVVFIYRPSLPPDLQR